YILQTGAGVATKVVKMNYNADGTFQSIGRYKDPGGTQLVAGTTFDVYDGLGRLSQMTHQNASQVLGIYTLTHDAGDRLVQTKSPDGISSYGYDAVDQLTTATYSFQMSEAYSYDKNGNRTGTSVPGPANRIQDDGVYTYAYDAEGNRTGRTKKGTNEVTQYDWDYRNRLTHEVVRNAGTTLMEVTYTYDVFDRRIAKTVSYNGQPGQTKQYAYDGEEMILAFAGSTSSATLTHRYLKGPVLDQLFVDEQVGGAAPGNYWALTDRLGTVRDVVTDSGAVQSHFKYNSYGQVSADTQPGDDFFAFTGREWDKETGMYFYRARYYDPGTGSFLSEDPEGLGVDTNPYRYVHNMPTDATDPSGLEEIKYRLPEYAKRLFNKEKQEEALVQKFWEAQGAGRQGQLNRWLNSPAIVPEHQWGLVGKDDELVTEWQVYHLVNFATAWRQRQQGQQMQELGWLDVVSFIARDVISYTDSPVFKAGA